MTWIHLLSFFFSESGLKMLASSVSVCPKHVDMGPSSSLRVRTMSNLRSLPSSLVAYYNFCCTEARDIIIEVMTPHRSPAGACICIRGMCFCFTFVPKQYGSARGLEVSLPCMACRALIMIVAGAKSGPNILARWYMSTLVVWHISVSLVPTFFKFFLDGNADHNMALNSKLHSPGLGLSLFSLSSSNGGWSSWSGYLPLWSPGSVSTPERSLTHCIWG